MYKDLPVPDLDVSATASFTPPNATARLFATERSAKRILCEGDCRYRIPTPAQRQALLVGFAMCGKPLIGKAYDAVRLEADVDLDSAEDIASKNASIVVVEIKSTNRSGVGPDLSGYFFNITASELTIAQTLKDQFRFVFLNIIRGDWIELTLGEVLARAKAMYPAFHIRL